MRETRRQLLARLDSIEKRIAALNTATPAAGQLETRIEEQRSERDRARARLDALDSKLAQITRRPAAMDTAIRESVRNQVETRLASVPGQVEARIAAKPAASESRESSAQHRVLARVANLENAVAAQHDAIVELRDCSIRAEERMQRILNGVDTLISTNSRRVSR